MRHSLDPWPAIADLFAGLLIVTFGGLILFTHLAEVERERASGHMRNPVDEKAEEIQNIVLDGLKQSLGGVTLKCGQDVCLDVAIEFRPDEDTILPDFQQRLRNACSALQGALGGDKNQNRSLIEIFIEGHTDRTQPKTAVTPRDGYLYNWRLSSARASSVLYEFTACGVSAPTYRILAIGFADTAPRCPESDAGCLQRNRRTTFRLRPDRKAIEDRVKHAPTSGIKDLR